MKQDVDRRDPDCVFCKIVVGELPSHKLWEDGKHMAFLSIFPNTEGVCVVIPKDHLPSYVFENDEKVVAELMRATRRVALMLDRAFEDVGRTGLIFEGFGVDHLHSKLYPMHGTGDMSKWRPIESKRTDFYKQYPGYLSSHDAGLAEEEELKLIAEKVRKAGELAQGE